MIDICMAGHRLFIDASGFIGLTSQKDRLHIQSNNFFRQIVEKRVVQITTNLIISETYTYLRYHENYITAIRFIENIKRAEKTGFLIIIYSYPSLEEKAIEILRKYNDQDLSYTDSISFAYLEIDQETKDVFTFDKHFYLTGCNILPFEG